MQPLSKSVFAIAKTTHKLQYIFLMSSIIDNATKFTLVKDGKFNDIPSETFRMQYIFYILTSRSVGLSCTNLSRLFFIFCSLSEETVYFSAEASKTVSLFDKFLLVVGL
jgi:hypothetical protein